MYCILYTLVDLYVLYTVQFALVAQKSVRDFNTGVILLWHWRSVIQCYFFTRSSKSFLNTMLVGTPCIYTFYKVYVRVSHGIHPLYIIWYAKALSTISFILKIPEQDYIPKELSLDHKLRTLQKINLFLISRFWWFCWFADLKKSGHSLTIVLVEVNISIYC